jgi:hypothetical protein
VSIIIQVAAVVLTLVVIGTGCFFLPNSPSSLSLNQYPDDGGFRYTGTLSGKDDLLIHSFHVNSSAVSMHVIMDCGFNDFDLYGDHGYTPSEYYYDWQGFESG